MKRFKGEITLIKNSRGCYILDTIKGCSIVKSQPRGCYDDCYAMNIASRYGMDFGTTVKREFTQEESQPSLFDFEDERHLFKILKAIREADMPFIRIGEMGDPSWDWAHTLAICEKVKPAGKPIVIITKHWTPIPDKLLQLLKGICINTSVSALDEDADREERLAQYERLKPYCKSVLRIVSANFNLENFEGMERAKIQDSLFKKVNTLDTVFRPSKTNPFLTRGVIKTGRVKFIKGEVLASVHNPKTYFGHCSTCPEMCGVNV